MQMCREGVHRLFWGRFFAMLIALFVGVIGSSARAGIINGSFEDGLNGWTATTFAAVTGPFTPTDLTHYAWAGGLTGASLSQTFTLDNDAGLLCLDMILVSVNNSSDAKLILPGDVEVTIWQLSGSTLVDSGPFRRYSYDVSDYAGQSVTLEFTITGNVSTSAQIGVDRILVKDAPEPATLALLAGGALMCVVRRGVGRA
jgi:hypothetical protein